MNTKNATWIGTIVAVLSTAIIGITATCSIAGCPLSPKPASTAQQEQDAIAVLACVTTHWGEDWLQLINSCGAQEFAVFCDIVADIEQAIAGKATDAGTVAMAITSKGRRSLYATQAPIARRLALKQQL